MKEKNEWLTQNVRLRADHSRVPTGMKDSNGPLLSCLFRKKVWISYLILRNISQDVIEDGFT
jgi:hypothetical protein